MLSLLIVVVVLCVVAHLVQTYLPPPFGTLAAIVVFVVALIEILRFAGAH